LKIDELFAKVRGSQPPSPPAVAPRAEPAELPATGPAKPNGGA